YVNILSPINTTYFYLLSELGTSPFQWYKDSQALDLAEVSGEISQEMYFNNVQIDSVYFGTYYCETGEGPSRNIILREPVYTAPEITGVFHAGDHVVVQWYQINDADHYDIYSSADPYANPASWTFEGSQNNIQTKIGWIDWTDFDVSTNKKFYFVKAVY
ncbi:MAG: hypothetical protein JXN63_00185, partial [Candidatus Delongbacteria bacterium]|nr:hypothetical protein [Candidatus Delongbacteria bacterium]